MGGARYIDLRPVDYNGVRGIRVGHGSQYGSPFSDMLPPVADFCRAQPKELLIVNVEMASPLKADQKIQLIDDIRNAWAPFMITSTDTWFHIGETTMRDVWAQGKNLLVLYEDVLLELDKYHPNGRPNTHGQSPEEQPFAAMVRRPCVERPSQCRAARFRLRHGRDAG